MFCSMCFSSWETTTTLESIVQGEVGEDREGGVEKALERLPGCRGNEEVAGLWPCSVYILSGI